MQFQFLSALEQRLETSRQTNDFTQVVRAIALSKGDLRRAASVASESRAGRASEFLTRAAQTAGALAPGGWGSELGDFKPFIEGFAQSLQSVGVFDALLVGGMKRAPITAQVGAVAVGVSAFTVSEGSVKPVGRMTIGAADVDPRKSTALISVTAELLRFGSPGTQALLTAELQRACVLAVDTAFVNSILLSGVTTGTSTGTSPAAVRSDISYLLQQVPTDTTSRLFIVTTPLIAKVWSIMGGTTSDAGPAFPGMTYRSGEISGIPVLTSDALAAGLVVLVDSTGVAGESVDMRLDIFRSGSIYADSAPDSPPSAATTVINLFQADQRAIVIERWWGAVKLRSSAVAAISNSSSYVGGFSPPI